MTTFVRSVELGNFKCFEHESVPLERLTLITGLNGTGKSSMIQALLLLRQSHEQGLLRSGRLAINGELVEIGTGKDALFEEAIEDVIKLGLTWSDGLTASWAFDYDRTADILSPADTRGGGDDTTYDRTPLSQDFHYLSAERTGPRAAFLMSDHVVGQLRQVGTRGEYVGHFLALFGAERVVSTELHHPEADSDCLIDQVNAWLSEVSPGVRLHVTAHRTIDAVELRFSFPGAHGRSNEYRTTNVGFGITYVLAVIAAVLSARRGALIIIENPESHLHPRGQFRMAQFLSAAAASGVQIVVETHSDHILNGLRLSIHGGMLKPDHAMIHYFERRTTAEGTYHTFITPTIDSNGRISDWPEGFFDEWELALRRLLAPAEPAERGQ